MALVRMQTRPQSNLGLLNGSFFRDFDRLFNEVATPAANTMSYAADLYETDEALVLEMAVPGFTGEDLDISVEDRVLKIGGKVNHEEKEENEERRYWMQSIHRSEFSRSLRLPKNVDVEAISASVTDGILHLNMPKAAEAKVKKIEISN